MDIAFEKDMKLNGGIFMLGELRKDFEEIQGKAKSLRGHL